jgi:hypothetical protein
LCVVSNGVGYVCREGGGHVWKDMSNEDEDLLIYIKHFKALLQVQNTCLYMSSFRVSRCGKKGS